MTSVDESNLLFTPFFDKLIWKINNFLSIFLSLLGIRITQVAEIKADILSTEFIWDMKYIFTFVWFSTLIKYQSTLDEDKGLLAIYNEY